jgi:hypothetical protein
MLKYGLTPRLQQVLRQLVEACTLAGTNDLKHLRASAVDALGEDTAQIGNERVLVTFDELIKLRDGRFVRLPRITSGRAEGSVEQLAFDVVGNNFEPPRAAPVVQQNLTHYGSGHLQATRAGNNIIRTGTDPAELLRHLAELTRELVESMSAALPADEAEAAKADARAVEALLASEAPDPEAVAKKSRTLWGRLSSAMGTGAELIQNGEKIGAAALKYAPWITLAWQALRSKVGHN